MVAAFSKENADINTWYTVLRAKSLLKTKLRGTRPKSAPKEWEEVETFLIEIKRRLLTKFDHLKKPKLSDRATRINELQKKLKDTEEVITPTDKTNSFKTILLRD